MADTTQEGAARSGKPAEAGGAADGRLDRTRIGMVLVAAVAILAAVIAAIGLGRGVEATLGNFKVNIERGDSFSDILNKALAEEGPRETAVALLAGKGFYQVTDPQIVGAIGELRPGDPESDQVVGGLRRMLWDLSGPFRTPGTMSHADARLVAAIEEQTARADDPSQGRLLAELVKRSLDRSGMFEVRRFAAQLEPLAPLAGPLAGGPPAIFTCPGSEMIGKQVQIWGAGQTVFGEVEPDIRMAASCEGAAKTIQQLLQGKAGVFGIAPEAYGVLTGTPPAGASPTPSFVLNPVDLAPQLFTRG